MVHLEKVKNGYIVTTFNYDMIDDDGYPDEIMSVFIDLEQAIIFIRNYMGGGIKLV